MSTNGKTKEESKMKKTMLMLCAAAGMLLAGSCTKTMENPQPQKMNITLTASIANPGTKTEYAEKAEGGLSVTWSTDDKMSLLVIGSDGSVVSNTVLVNESGAVKNAEFTGTIPTLAEGQKYLCVYPALSGELNDLKSNAGWVKYDVEGKKLIYNPYPEDQQFYVNETLGTWQNAFREADLMVGVPEISGSAAHVVLERQIGVLKLIIKITDDLKTTAFTMCGLINALHVNSFVTSMESDLSAGTTTFTGTAMPMAAAAFRAPLDASAGELAVYLPFGPGSIPKGTYQVAIADMENEVYRVSIVSPTEDVQIVAGQMTTLTIGSITEWINPDEMGG